jgi:hypothetical protein
MLETCIKFLAEHWPKLTVLLCIVIIAVSITWVFAKKAFHWKGRIESTEADCKKIEGHILPKLQDISTSISGLAGSFNNLVIHLGAKDQSLDKSLFMSKSPLQLTPLGLEILLAIGGKDFIDAHVDTLISEMDAIGVKTALDSQTIAPLVINKVSNEDSFIFIKNFIYKNPIYRTKTVSSEEEISVSLDMSTVSNILGIYLRDKYLAKHPDLNPQDIPNVIKP